MRPVTFGRMFGKRKSQATNTVRVLALVQFCWNEHPIRSWSYLLLWWPINTIGIDLWNSTSIPGDVGERGPLLWSCFLFVALVFIKYDHIYIRKSYVRLYITHNLMKKSTCNLGTTFTNVVKSYSTQQFQRGTRALSSIRGWSGHTANVMQHLFSVYSALQYTLNLTAIPHFFFYQVVRLQSISYEISIIIQPIHCSSIPTTIH